jgi:hypothetical protein
MADILLVDISKGFTWDILGDLHSFMYINNYILWDCITDAKLTKSRVIVNAIHIAISIDLGVRISLGFCVWTWLRPSDTSRFFHLDLLSESSAWTGCPGSWIFFGIWTFSFFFFFQTVFATLCVCLDMAAANWAFRIRTGCPDSGQRAWLQGELLAAHLIVLQGGAWNVIQFVESW